jgi:homoserine O-succinyltransferase
MPVSRFTETKRQDLINEDLEVLAESTLSGVGMVRSRSTKDLYILNNLEYDAETLKDEYLRDKNENINNQVVGEKWKMINLLGDEVENLKFFNFHKDQKTHIYGKKEVKNGRKMGHITYPI